MNEFDDLHWDQPVAEETIAALRRVANILDVATHERAYGSRDATDEWHGRYRDEFDHLLEQLLNRSMRLAADFRDVADQIALANQRVLEERQHRQQQRRG